MLELAHAFNNVGYRDRDLAQKTFRALVDGDSTNVNFVRKILGRPRRRGQNSGF